MSSTEAPTPRALKPHRPPRPELPFQRMIDSENQSILCRLGNCPRLGRAEWRLTRTLHQRFHQISFNSVQPFRSLGHLISAFANESGKRSHREKRPCASAKRLARMHFGSEYHHIRSAAICMNSLELTLFHRIHRYCLDSSETFIPNLLHYCYATPIEKLSPRRLALLLMVLSVGSIVDLNRPLGSLHGEAYHHLARAAVCEIPLMEEPDFDVLHALVKSLRLYLSTSHSDATTQFIMLWYHLSFSDNNKAIGYAWNLMGFVAKLAQGVSSQTIAGSSLTANSSSSLGYVRRRCFLY